MRKILALLLFLLNTAVGSAQDNINFPHIGKESGLPDNAMQAICQDANSMIWMATSSGVVRYDGMSFQRFENDIDDSTSISSQILDLHLDTQGSIWCATPVGIQKFDERSESFKTYNIKDYRDGIFFSYIYQIEDYSPDTLLLLSASEGPILFSKITYEAEYLFHTRLRNFLPKSASYNKIAILENGDMAIGTTNNGFYFWSQREYKGIHCLKGIKKIKTLTVDEKGIIWFPYGDGLGTFSPQTKKITKHSYAVSGSKSNNNEIETMAFYDSKLYIGTIGEGLLILDTATMFAQCYNNTVKNPQSIPGNSIKCFFQDNMGNIWIGTSNSGIAIKQKVNKDFFNESIQENCTFSRCNFINDYLQSSTGTEWVALDGAGLNFKHKGDDSYTSALDFAKKRIFGVTALCEGKDGGIWVGTYRHGLYKIDEELNVLAHYDTSRTTPERYRIKSNFIKSLCYSSNNTLWIATVGGGVTILKEESGISRFLYLDPYNTSNTISCSDATSFYEDSKHRMWITTYWGLNLFSLNGEFTKKWVNDEHTNTNLSSNVIYDIIEDENAHFWVATMYGINHFDYGDTVFQHLNESNGLASNNVSQLQIDSKGNIWVGTSDGLSKYDIKTKQFFNFFNFNGLSSSVFRYVSYTASDGKMFWGTEKGIISFYPERIEVDTVPPKVIITEFRLFNKRIIPADGPILRDNICNTTDIELEHSQNFIGFEFSALNFVDFSKTKFKYRLLGADKDWISTGIYKRSADYSNLAPGDYTFQVQATNNDGIWSSAPTEIKIHIIPPFYNTALFRFFIISFVLIGMFYYMKYREKKLQAAKDKLEIMVAERTHIIAAKTEEIQEQNSQLKVLNNTKDMFFSIIAHDLKNPLNALMGFSSLLSDKFDDLPDEKKKKFISVINDSSRNMYGLLVNLLDWARSQTGNLQFEPAVHNLMPIVEESTLLISPQTDHKSVHLKNLVTTNFQIYTDINMLKTVLRNLITNAIKFSFRDDIIEVGVSGKEGNNIIIYVKDKGVGIPKDAIAKLFDANASETTLGTEKEKGSGLGLIICKEFVEMNKGRIWCTSEQGKGTTFFFTVPTA